MPIADWEIWACANKLVELHGKDAPIHAAMRADELLFEGDLDGAATFRLIVRRAEQLLAKPDSRPH